MSGATPSSSAMGDPQAIIIPESSATGSPTEQPVTPRRKRQVSPPLSEDEEDDAPFDAGIGPLDIEVPSVEDAASFDAATTNDAVTGDLEKLKDHPFSHWVNKHTDFARNILGTSPDVLIEISISNPAVFAAYELLSTHVEVTKRSGSLASVMEVLNQVDHVSLCLAQTHEQVKDWSANLHWARFLVVLASLFSSPPDSLLDRAKIHSRLPIYGTLWVMSKIIIRNRRPNDLKRLTNKLANRNVEAAQRSLITATQNATLGLSKTQARAAAKASAKVMSSRGAAAAGPSTKRAKKAKISPEFVESSDESEFADSDGEEIEPTKEPELIEGLNELQIIESYVQEMIQIEASQAKDPKNQARLQRSGRTMYQHMQNMRKDPAAKTAYFRNLCVLYNSGMAHINDITTISRPNKQLNPIRKQALADHKRNSQIAAMLSNAVEEDAEAGNDVLNQLAAEERAEVTKRADKSADAHIKEEVFDNMIDIPKESAPDATLTMFKNSKTSAGFSPAYIGDACREAKITDLSTKLMPRTNYPLRWWQVIGTKWATDLVNDPVAMHILGGVVADMIGLGKTTQAAGTLMKTVNMFDDRHDPEIEEFLVEHAFLDTSTHLYERPGDLSRPSGYSTSAALCHQTAKELAAFSPELQVFLVGGDSTVITHSYKVIDDFPAPDSSVWDTSNPRNIRKLYVVSYNWIAKHYGPQAYWASVRRDIPAFCTEKGISLAGFDFHSYSAEPENQPDSCPANRVRSFAGLFAHWFADECQDGLRNPSSFWRSLRWLRPRQMILMSGYPAPRGMEDFGSYLRLLERPELVAEHDRLFLEYKVNQGLDPEFKPDYIPHTTSPYDLPNDHPCAKFRFLYRNWVLFITNEKSPNYDQRIVQGKLAQKTLEMMVLRRDFDTALPVGSTNTIGRALPPKHHYTVERIFSPSIQREYDNQFGRWKSRLFTTHKNSAGANVPAMNARANRASQIIDFLPIAGWLHVEQDAAPRPKDSKYGDGDDRLDEKYNKDRESWFYEASPLFKAYDALPKMKPGGKGDRIRWIFKTAKLMGCESLGDDLQFDTMSNADLAQLFLNHSPKMQAVLALYTDWGLLRDEKIIYWFMTPLIQEMTQTVLELLGHDLFSIYSSSSTRTRSEVQDAWNNVKTKKRILLASGLVFGTGYNLQKDSRVGVLVDTPDTDNREKQILGRQYRGGQKLEVHFFRLTVRGTYSVNRFAENLLSSLSAASAFLDYTSADSSIFPESAPTVLVDRIKDNYLDGFIRVADIEVPMNDADYSYYFIFSPDAKPAVDTLRKDWGAPDTWWPECLPFTTVLAGIAARADTRKIRRVAGFPQEHVEDIIRLTGQELMARKEEREEKNQGVDPDDKYYNAKTPKKKKADGLTRTKDAVTDVNQIAFPSGSAPAWANAPLGADPTVKTEEELLSVKLEDEAKLRAYKQALKEAGETAEESEVTDFEDDLPSVEDFQNRMLKHTRYMPTIEDVQVLTPQDKRKLSLFVKANRDDKFEGFKQKKKSKAKGKGKGKKRKSNGK